jgi:hypothetical protein
MVTRTPYQICTYLCEREAFRLSFGNEPNGTNVCLLNLSGSHGLSGTGNQLPDFIPADEIDRTLGIDVVMQQAAY